MRLIIISVHGCPVARAGEKDAGGMNVYLLEVARRLAAKGVKVDVFTRSHQKGDPEIVDIAPGARVVHLKAGPLYMPKADIYSFLPLFRSRLVSFIEREGTAYDLIYSNYWLSGLVGMELSCLWGVPHATAFHTTAALKYRARPGETEAPERLLSERRIVKEAHRIIVWTHHERESLMSYYDANPETLVIIPPGVDCDFFKPFNSPSVVPDKKPPLILYIGRVTKIKGLYLLMDAFSLLDHQDARLRIVGGSYGEGEMKRLMHDVRDSSNFANRVEFVEAVTREELPYHYSEASVCVLPSYYESFGLSALEAAACGKPVVAFKVGGLDNIVIDGRTGYLVPWRCPEPFAEKLNLLISNDALRRNMGIAARARAQALDWDSSINDLMNLFRDLVNGSMSHHGNLRSSQTLVETL